jgi:hypothetical protein
MILLQADTINGVYEVTDFDNGVPCTGAVSEFLEALSLLGDGQKIGLASSDAVAVSQIDAEYGIKRLKA